MSDAISRHVSTSEWSYSSPFSPSSIKQETLLLLRFSRPSCFPMTVHSLVQKGNPQAVSLFPFECFSYPLDQKAREECESHLSMYEECKGGKFLLKERRCRKLKEVWNNCYSSKLKQLMEETKKGKAQPNVE
ncbi:uncharacterized protein LOC104422244 isoform X1 [Eucalyptus grandis]|uniref:uncharacterized protein LOC104422244 isoform X1 n=1 Tax=Eucalyptus grandis TaxID=71139 RepID=UPI00192EAD01|nr:uncharacterized protein LOC104422244 isoform X1 [Eucalyptus grandis]